jgi:hypothetical protein
MARASGFQRWEGQGSFFTRRRAALRGHLAAGFGTLSAHVGAPGHLLVTPGHALTVLGTCFANFGADAAGALVKGRSPNHEVSTGHADLSTICQQALVVDRGMLAAYPEAVDRRFQTGPVAIKTVLNALLHVHNRGPRVVDAPQTSSITPAFPEPGHL